MQLLLAGVRGSTPVSGPEYLRYGGSTSCVAVAHDGESPRLVLDGGTGLRRLSRSLDGGPFQGTILLGHLHWDHTHGLPFFPAAAHPDSAITVLLPGQGDPIEVLGRALGPPHFPLRPDELRGRWSFGRLVEAEHDIEGFTVLARAIPHLDSTTLGLRVSDGTATLAYLSDHNPTALGPGPDGLGERHRAALELAEGVDLLVHDAQHTAAELADKAFLGHAAAEYAVALAEEAGAKRVLLYHHDPDRSDDEIDVITAHCQSAGVAVEAAVEGRALSLGGERACG